MNLDYFIKNIPDDGILRLETEDDQNEINLWFNHRNEYMATLTFTEDNLISVVGTSPANSPDQLLLQIQKKNPDFLKYDWIVYRERSDLIKENSKLKEEIKKLYDEIKTLNKTIEECDELFFLMGDV